MLTTGASLTVGPATSSGRRLQKALRRVDPYPVPADRPSLRPTVVVAAVGLLGVLLTTLPDPGSDAHTLWYLVPVLLCTAVMAAAVPRIPRGFRRPWWWLLASQGLYLTGEVWFAVLALRGDETWPTAADFFYLAAYVPVAVGFLALNRQRTRSRARGSLLDAAILSLSATTLFGVFVILPIASDGSQPLMARLVSSAYPVCDLVLIFLVARLVTGAGARPPGFWLLVAGTSSTIVADIGWNLQQLTTGGVISDRWLNVLWLAYYVGFAAAAVNARNSWRPQTRDVTTAGLTAPRLVVLAIAAVLPSAVLTTLSLLGRPVPVAWLAAGSVALVALVVARLWDLLQQLRRQSRTLENLARTDPLTGIANRRTLEHHLARVCRAGRSDVFLALIDLDHFKAYNDLLGHHAGDDLLKAATAAWVERLGPDTLLARWGGEEFVAVVQGSEGSVTALLDDLRAVVPDGQTCSIGVSRWSAGEPPEATLQRADGALYAAKAAGRNRVESAVQLLG